MTAIADVEETAPGAGLDGSKLLQTPEAVELGLGRHSVKLWGSIWGKCEVNYHQSCGRYGRR